MKTLLDFPRPRDPQANEAADSQTTLWSRFPDVVGLWVALGEEAQPREFWEVSRG